MLVPRIAWTVASLAALFGAGVFAAGSFAAEGAIHPARQQIAKVCPCISHVHCEPVSVTGADGVTLHAWYYTPDAPNGGAIILLHGIGASREDMVALGNVFLKQGYAALEPDLRGHGESGGFTTYGLLEEADIAQWVDLLVKADPVRRVYGFGASLGASVLLESLRREERFRGVVAESPYSDFPSIAKERIGRMMPDGLHWVATPFVDSGLTWIRWTEKVDLEGDSPLDGIRQTAVPVLLIHGLADGKTSPENSRRLAAADPNAELWLVPNSGHADAWSTNREEFERRVLGWLEEHR